MTIQHIANHSAFSNESDVTLSDGTYSLTCFACHLYLGVGSVITEPLYAICTENIKKSFDNIFSITAISKQYSYIISGLVVDTQNNIVKIGNIKIELDMPFPFDIQEGNYISFSCSRVDII
jgi:hypothetical protein